MTVRLIVHEGSRASTHVKALGGTKRLAIVE